MIGQTVGLVCHWLDSKTVLYTHKQNDSKYQVMAYVLENNETYIFRENAIHPSLSINKDFFPIDRLREYSIYGAS